VLDEIVAKFMIVDCALTTIVIDVVLPAPTSDVVQTTDELHVQPPPVALTNVAPDGSGSFTLTFVASCGPLFAIVSVNVIGLSPDALIEIARSAPLCTPELPVLTQPFVVTVTLTDVVPFVNVIALVPCPLVIVPPVADQLYVVPLAPAGTDAELPLTLMFAFGACDSVTTFDALVLQPLPFVTVTL